MKTYTIYLKYIYYFFERKLKDDVGPIFASSFLVTFIQYVNLYLVFDYLISKYIELNQSLIFIVLLPMLFSVNYFLLWREDAKVPERINKLIFTAIFTHATVSIILTFMFPPIIM